MTDPRRAHIRIARLSSHLSSTSERRNELSLAPTSAEGENEVDVLLSEVDPKYYSSLGEGASLASAVNLSPSEENISLSDKVEKLKSVGWGYDDTRFSLNDNGDVEITGDRYPDIFPSARVMPKLRSWVEEHTGINVDVDKFQSSPSIIVISSPVINPEFLEVPLFLTNNVFHDICPGGVWILRVTVHQQR